MTSKFDVFKKIALVLFLNFLTFFVVIQLQGNLDQANAATTTNSTDYASIVSKTSINKTATILDSKRNDGVYFSGPALTSASTMTANASGNSYNGDTVTVEEINLTKRSNGIEYTYAEVYDSTAKKTYWIDQRAILASISSQTTVNYQATINDSARSDKTYSAPALSSWSSLTGSTNSYDGDKVTVIASAVTTRGNGTSYTYLEVKYGSLTFWIDSRAVLAQITSSIIENYSAVIEEGNRADGIYTNGPALTSASTLTANGSITAYVGNIVAVTQIDTTKRTSGGSYQYARVTDVTAGKTYWVDVRSLSMSKYATIISNSTMNSTYKIADYARNDGTYSSPALTSSSALVSTVGGRVYDGDTVTVTKEDVTKRSNGTTYTYAYVTDPKAGKSYWIDFRALAATTMNGYDESSYQSGISNGSISGSFVIVKATQGTDYVNPAEASEVASTVAAGKKLGLYSYAETGNAISEAEYFVSNIKSYLKDNPILILDWEGSALTQGPTWAKQWLDEVYNLTGIRPLIYMSKSVTSEYNWSSVAPNYGLWVAEYATTASTGYQSNPWTNNDDYGAWSTPTIFQYTDNGSLSGYGGALDLDLFYGDFEDWDRLAGLAY
ncbi:GW dipeptide domain-containing protein [Oenococcus oeni]